MLPDIPIVDAHVHLWNPQELPISWIKDNATLDRAYLLPDYHQQTVGVNIAAFVYVQVDVEPAFGLVEAQWAVAQADQDARLQGIVAYAPLEYGEQTRAYLEALVKISPRLIKGVRRILQGEVDPAFCLQPDFIKGVQLLVDYGLSFDLCVNYRQLGPVIELVRQCPLVNFMLDHIGKPGIAHGLYDPWRQHIKALAALPNVMCKLSGVITEADRQTWHTDDLTLYIEHVLTAFGSERVAFGSDWPVLRLAGTYRNWVEIVEAQTRAWPPAAKAKLWAENARRFYRLDNP